MDEEELQKLSKNPIEEEDDTLNIDELDLD